MNFNSNFKYNTHGPLAALLIGSAWLLAGCSGEPGNADIEKALTVNAAQGNVQMEQLSKGSSQAFMPQVHAARKLGCKPDTSAAFVCDVELDLTPPRGVRTRTNASLRFVQGSDGWAVAR
ncbi:MAG: hypothetical protein EON48_09780 [Acetobacteraceae bacterium]|nr:MAG: hypothetical protein EON48_09780 [Acetobacteraceae bacterium]